MEKDFMSNKAKDSLPIETIKKARDILSNLGICAIEKVWLNQLNNFYSVRLEFSEMNVGANGKGVSYEFALASAYGELLERLQNQFLYQQNIDFEDCVNKEYGFLYAPDEKYFSNSDVIRGLPREIKDIFMNDDNDSIEISECIEAFLHDQPEPYKEGIVCLPYFSKRKSNIIYLPKFLVNYYYTSHGMAAGNTPEEALVQGLCEIFERYAIREVLKGKVTPPSITEDFLKKFDKQYNMIKKFQASTGQKIIVKDVSLGKRLPVVALIFINTTENTYFVKFGASPAFEIAVERCLMEFLQGKSIENLYGYSPYRFHMKDEREKLFSERNSSQIYYNGQGFFPNDFFSNDHSYDFNCPSPNTFSNNKEMLNQCIKVVWDLGFDILCRDVSFLGFPAFHVIVPGMSEIDSKDLKYFQSFINKRKTREIIRTGKYLKNDKDLECSVKYFEEKYEKLKDSNRDNLSDAIGLPAKNNFCLKKISLDFFLSISHYKMGDFKRAHKYMEKHIESIHNESEEVRSYYNAVRDFMAMKEEKYDNDKININLSPIYGESIVNRVIDIFSNPEKLILQFPNLYCWKCKDCFAKNDCFYDSIKTIHRKLKEQIYNNNIYQMRCATILKLQT